MGLVHFIFIAFALITCSKGDLQTDAETLLQHLFEVTQNASTFALQELWTGSAEIAETADQVVTVGLPLIQSSIDKILEYLGDIKSGAAAAQVNITYCLDEYELDLNNTIGEAKLGLYDCTNSILNTGLNILGKCLGAINNLIEDTHETQRQLNNCQKNEICLADVITKINVQTIEIPNDIIKQKDSGIRYVGQLKAVLATCPVIQEAELNAISWNYLNALAECVDRIIG